jgi:exosome complex RNA-binding protein Csl4
MNTISTNKKAYPGKFLGYAYDYSLGESGVYRKDDKIFSSISGEIIINNSFTPPKLSVKNELTEYVPKAGDEVYLKITKVTNYVATGEIVAIKNKVIRVPMQGLIKSENVKPDFKEFDMFDCFTTGDIVFCKVLSIDQTNFIYLSTQDVSYGVVFSRSPFTNNIMMPVSFEKMMCMDTKIQENKKVAKPNYI